MDTNHRYCEASATSTNRPEPDTKQLKKPIKKPDFIRHSAEGDGDRPPQRPTNMKDPKRPGEKNEYRGV